MSYDEAGTEAVTRECTGDAGSGGKPSAAPSGLPVPDGVAVVQYEWHGAWVVVARGAYDVHSITPLAAAMRVAAAQHEKVVLDASGVAFVDSALLNLLIRTRRATDLRLAAPPPQLRRILELTGVDAILRVHATVEDAAVG
ncbi:STAS domain-containing protein [Streptomyces ziwulingensis]